jgi:large subunit ribosomal protein L4
MRSILTKKLAAESINVVEDFTVDTGKTRDLVNIIKGFSDQQRTVLVYHEDDQMLKRAGRNVPWLKMLSYDRLSAHELFYGRKVLITESAAEKLNEFYAKKLERGRT